jgi:hypothetical protein
MLRRLAIALAALALVPSGADACCIGGHRYPPHYHAGQQPLPPLAIGDSVMLDAVRPLANEGFEVDARQGRFMYHVLRILRTRHRQDTLPHLVVVSIGVNFPATAPEIRRALQLLGPNRVLGLVTPKRSWRGLDATPIWQAARRHPRRVKVLDWVSYSAGHPEWFVSDGTHLRSSGVAAYVRLLATALRYRVSGKPRSTSDVAGSGHREVTTLPRE